MPPYSRDFTPIKGFGGRPAVFVLIIYSLSNFMMLTFPGAIFWDDWTLFGNPKPAILNHFFQVGLPHAGYLNWLLTLLGPGGVRALVFSLEFVAVWTWFNIVRITPGVSKASAILSVGIAVAFPFFLARVAAINAISVLALAFFLVGWWLFVTGWSSGGSKKSNFGAFLLFTAGFLYAAFIPLALLTFLHLGLVAARNEMQIPWKKLGWIATTLFASHALILLLQRLLFPPEGSYEGYRAISIGLAQVVPAVIGFLALVSFLYLLRWRNRRGSPFWHQGLLEMALLAIIGFLLAISPYILIGSFPPYLEWKTRYELNYFIPASFAALSVFGLFDGKRDSIPLRLLGVLILVVSIAYSNYQLLRFYVDGEKYKHVAEVLSENSMEINGKFVVFVDETEQLNAMNRSLRSYEWSGLLSDVTGDRQTFGIGASSFEPGLALYREGLLDSGLNVVYNYRWEKHVHPAETALVRIWLVQEKSCGWLNLSVPSCINVELLHKSPVRDVQE